jgi:hypothetical protein
MRWGPPRPIEDRFEAKVDRSAGPTAVIFGLAVGTARDYGKLGINKTVTTAHRVAFILSMDIGRGIACTRATTLLVSTCAT